MTLRRKYRLNEIFIEPYILGPFEICKNWVPFFEVVEDEQLFFPHILDFEYVNGYSGNKLVTPLTYSLITSDSFGNLVIDSTAQEILNKVLFSHYNRKWKSYYDIYTFVYDFLNNYNVTESENIHRDIVDALNSETGSGSSSTNGTNVRSGGSTRSPNLTTNTDNYRWALNDPANSPTPVNRQVTVQNGQDSTTYNNMTDTISSTESNQYSKSRQFDRDEDIESGKTRKGLIMRDPQDLLEKELEFWKNDIVSKMYKDLDEILCLKVFDGCLYDYHYERDE